MKIETAKLLAQGGTGSDLLAAMADICGKPIAISAIGGVQLVCLGAEYHRLGAITARARHNGKGTAPLGGIEISYQDIINIDGTRTMIHIFIGVRGFGPILQADEDGWTNCYPHGNCGGNASDGGTWYSPNRSRNPAHPDIASALNARHDHNGDAVHNAIIDGDQLRVSAIAKLLA